MIRVAKREHGPAIMPEQGKVPVEIRQFIEIDQQGEHAVAQRVLLWSVPHMQHMSRIDG
ncbi:hypothetical protein D3C80_2155200 [compost metagenome]